MGNFRLVFIFAIFVSQTKLTEINTYLKFVTNRNIYTGYHYVHIIIKCHIELKLHTNNHIKLK